MSKSARRLGRGLDSLVSNLRSDAQAEVGAAPGVATLPEAREADSGEHRRIEARMVPIDALAPNPWQPRDNTSEQSITSLAESIRQTGMLQPISVRFVSGGYQVIAGERRWRAAKSIGSTEVPVIVREATDEQMLEFALIENIQREDLNAIERAKAYREFCTRFGAKPEHVGARLGEDRTTVVNYLRLLDLPDTIQALLAERRIGMGHARCLLGVADEARRLRLAEAAAQNGLSVRALEEIVRRTRTGRTGPQPGLIEREHPRSAHLRDLQQRFEEALKTKVTIREGKRKGTGRIVLEYYTLDDYDRIAAALGVATE